MTPLAHSLGLSKKLSFYDVYSLTESELLALIPRPVHALLVILPLTPAWNQSRISEDDKKSDYEGKGEEEPVIWFKQTIGHACGSIGLTHCLLNGKAQEFIEQGSLLETMRRAVVDLPMSMLTTCLPNNRFNKHAEERAQWLYDSKEFEHYHQSVASLGDTLPPSASDGDKLGQHFVAFVKGDDGHLYELEGSRKGPLDRGLLGKDEDVLSPRGIELGIGRVIAMEKESGGGDLRFSVTALAES